MTIDEKKAEIEDAKGWIEDLKSLNGTTEEFINARRHVAILEDDLKKLQGKG